MRSDEIGPAVRDLIKRHIRSVDHAEALLHLAGAPDELHEAEVVARRHAWARDTAAEVLDDLVDTGIARRSDGKYALAPESVPSPVLASLADLYHRHPVTLVRAIYAAPHPFPPFIRPARTGDGETGSTS